MMKDNNKDNGIVAAKHGNVRAHKCHPCRRASPVIKDRQTSTYKSRLLNQWKHVRSASVEECTTIELAAEWLGLAAVKVF